MAERYDEFARELDRLDLKCAGIRVQFDDGSIGLIEGAVKRGIMGRRIRYYSVKFDGSADVKELQLRRLKPDGTKKGEDRKCAKEGARVGMINQRAVLASVASWQAGRVAT